ncbi:MAG: 7-cyano-7-deazaguanine synthase QueC [Candidatus Marinimicrobia bacterium]|nr:7-cyano-7-deazaguanine synthase QueC [Candidatus Neomarinimicrobiota bacterium]
MRRKETGERRKTVILVSGGMDSCVTVATAIEDGYQPAFLHINYGQRTESRELIAFNEIADHYQVNQKLVVDLSHLARIGGSCLTDENIAIPIADLDSKDIPISYVPFRNANILAAATSWAEVLGANAIFVGAVEEDSSGYPDCRRSFFDAFEDSIEKGTKPGTQIKIFTPLIYLSKKEIVVKGIKLNAPLDLTWSCYKNEDIPCGECDSCALRARGFEQAGIIDPIL